MIVTINFHQSWIFWMFMIVVIDFERTNTKNRNLLCFTVSQVLSPSYITNNKNIYIPSNPFSHIHQRSHWLQYTDIRFAIVSNESNGCT